MPIDIANVINTALFWAGVAGFLVASAKFGWWCGGDDW